MEVSSKYPPSLPLDQLHLLRDTAINWSLAHGLVIRPAERHFANNASVIHAPVTLFPSPFPRAEYEKAIRLQPIWNELVHKISEDEEFLKEVMDNISKVDDFTNKLYRIYTDNPPKYRTQSLSLGLHRSDYLLHQSESSDPPYIQQVEFNTIASSFGSLSTLTAELHSHLLNSLSNFYPSLSPTSLPHSTSLRSLSNGLAKAWTAYNNPESVILMVVQPGERNAFDQLWLEYELLTQHKIRLIRRTLSEIGSSAHLKDTPERELIISDQEIAVAYFRAGYGPKDYTTEHDWVARATIERSKAIKAPSIAYQLVGAKKVQQVLARPGMLERFFNAQLEHVNALRAVFTGLYPLDSSKDGIEAYEQALKEPKRFVMKPQREGGGNNIYGEDIIGALQTLKVEERNAYILMDLIKAPQHRNLLLREGEIIDGQVVSELGVFGVYLRDGGTTLLNEAAGHLLRTKLSESNEGGVAAGFAVIDSPLLV